MTYTIGDIPLWGIIPRMTEDEGDRAKLISLARMEESENNIKTEEVSFSDITREICDSFKALAEIQNKRLLCETEASVNIRADGVKLGQLVSILIDNAIKYSADEGEISVELVKQNRSAMPNGSVLYL